MLITVHKLKKGLKITAAAFGLAASVAFAEQPPSSPKVIVSSGEGLLGIVASMAGWIYSLAIVLSVIMILYAAYTYITAAGNSEKAQEANKIILYAVIGIVVALMAKSIPLVIDSILHSTTPGAGSTGGI